MYPPRGFAGGAVDASLGYRQRSGQDEGDLSVDTFVQTDAVARQPMLLNQPERRDADPTPTRSMQQHYPTRAQSPIAGGRQASTAPMQFHRPIRQTSIASPTSPFQDPADTSTDGFTAAKWSPTETPPDYTSYASHASQPHPRSLQPHAPQPQQSRVDPTVQRYHLSD